MRRSYKLQDLGCANCASKMESAINKIDGVNKATISFMTSRLTLDVADEKLDDVLPQAQSVCTKYEADCRILF